MKVVGTADVDNMLRKNQWGTDWQRQIWNRRGWQRRMTEEGGRGRLQRMMTEKD